MICRSGSAPSTPGSTSSARSATGGCAPSCSTSALDIVTGLWNGQPFSYAGKHYTIEPTEFPTIGNVVQEPRVPIWCVGMLGKKKSMARALRWDGLLPSGAKPGVAAVARPDPGDPRRARRPRLRHRDRGRRLRALAGGLGTRRRHVVDRVDVGRGPRDRRRPRRQRPADPGPAARSARAAHSSHRRRFRTADSAPVTESGWNFAEVWESIADQIPDAPAQRYDGQMWTWREFDQRADAIAVVPARPRRRRAGQGGAVPLQRAALPRVGLRRVQGRARRRQHQLPLHADELAYLWDNADVVAVVFHGAFVEQCDGRARPAAAHRDVALGRRRHQDRAPTGRSRTRTSCAASAPGRAVAPWGRSGDHLLLIYTGGTTGMPKGVMWRQDDLYPCSCSSRRSAHAAADADLTRLVVHDRQTGPARTSRRRR